MAITDELRAVAAKTECANGRCEKLYRGDLDCIADNIDAEHAEAQRRWMAEVDALREERDEYLESTKLWEAKCKTMVELPRDADGEPIHVGDVMKGEKIGGGFCEPFDVVGYIMSNGELEPMDEHKCPRKRKYLHHHKQPTVEDVLREFALACEDAGNAGPEVTRLAAEYAAKLRLAGEGE